MSPPLCFDVAGDVRLKLLHHPSSELTVNGELESVTNGGFRRIVIHFKANHHIEVDTKGITIREGDTETPQTGEDLITVGSVTIIRRDKQIDVATGDTRMVILIHEKDGGEFLWPVLRQQPSNSSTTGVLALKPAVYEEVPQTHPTKLRLNNQEVEVSRSDAVDYSVVSSPSLNCWLLPADKALQRSLDDFVITQI